MEARSEDRTPYMASADATAQSIAHQDETIARALLILRARVKRGPVLGDSKEATNWLQLEIGESEREIFGIITLDAHHRMIGRHDLFYGSVDRATVHPREVLKACVRDNAAEVIMYHNHPSGIVEPSTSDCHITERLRVLLTEIDVEVTDHIVVSSSGSTSMRARGLI